MWQFELNGQIVVLLTELLLLQSRPSRHAANPLQTPCWGNRQDFHQGTGHKNKLGHAASTIHCLIPVHCELSWYPSVLIWLDVVPLSMSQLSSLTKDRIVCTQLRFGPSALGRTRLASQNANRSLAFWMMVRPLMTARFAMLLMTPPLASHRLFPWLEPKNAFSTVMLVDCNCSRW